MKGAFGALQWKPETFWRSTLTEYVIAIEGFNEANGANKTEKAPTKDEMKKLLERYG